MLEAAFGPSQEHGPGCIHEVCNRADVHVAILGSSLPAGREYFSFADSFSVRTSGLNAAPVGELLAWDFEIVKDGWNGGPMGCVGKAVAKLQGRMEVWLF